MIDGKPNFIWTELSDKDAAELKEAIQKEGRKPTMYNFGDAPIKAEGQWVKYDNNAPDPTPEEIAEMEKNSNTWIEFPVPDAMADECCTMVNAWLKSKGLRDYEQG